MYYTPLKRKLLLKNNKQIAQKRRKISAIGDDRRALSIDRTGTAPCKNKTKINEVGLPLPLARRSAPTFCLHLDFQSSETRPVSQSPLVEALRLAFQFPSGQRLELGETRNGANLTIVVLLIGAVRTNTKHPAADWLHGVGVPIEAAVLTNNR